MLKTKKTTLNNIHHKLNANMVPFGSYEMPLWYSTGAKKEHIAVITNAGLFDTSHMDIIKIEGDNSFNLLQHTFTRNLEINPLKIGKAIYGAFLNENGECIDDAIIYPVENSIFMIVVNSNMGDVICTHLKQYSTEKNIKITDISSQVDKIDLQGPQSVNILTNILKTQENIFEDFTYFSFKGHFDHEPVNSQPVLLKDNTPILLSRTGYTGELGFEIFASPSSIQKIWEMLMSEGECFGILPCGLAARDSLRTGALLPLSHQDIGPWPFMNNPWTYILPYNSQKIEFTKTFTGNQALLNVQKQEFTYPFTGNDLRKISNQDNAIVMNSSGEEIGQVLTCVTDMAISKIENKIYSIASTDKPKNFKPKGLCCGFVKVNEQLSLNQKIELKDNRRSINVNICQSIRPAKTARIKINRGEQA